MAKANKEKVADIKPFEQLLWSAADKLRKNIDAAEYKHYVLGLLFLKYVADAFEELHTKILNKEGEHAYDDPEDKLVYSSNYVFFVPTNSRWNYLVSRAKLPTIGEDVDTAMDLIEKENPKLRGVLPKQFARPQLDKMVLGELIDVINNINIGNEAARKKDLLGVVYEYFLGQFALAEGRKGGQFYTPRSVVQLLIDMLQPTKGKVYDPCCGSGGMFVMSEKFVLQHQGRIGFTEKLQDAINQYNRKSITALEMLELLLEITKDVNSEFEKGNNLGLTETEKAFYDALTSNKSARDLMGDEKLMVIAKELVARVKKSTTIDWTIRQSAKDRVKLEVKRVLRFHQYPPDDEPRATATVLEQAELHAGELV